IGGQYGSEGKGQIVGYLSKEYDLLMRVGGPNAGHSVSSESGLYVYHHLPSGCRDASAEVLLGPGMTLKPAALVKEIEEVKISSDRLSIDPNAMVIEEEDLINEQELVEKIASTGRGGGSAAARRILNRYGNGIRLAKDVVSLKPYIRSTLERLQIAYRDKKSVLLEGTQGSALSLYHGKYPHVTSRDTNVAGCLAEAGISPTRVRRVIMVIRTHPIRVGNPDNDKDTSGYLKHETSWDEIARSAGLPIDDLVKTEITSTTKRSRRVGYFDWEQFQHAVALNSPTDIVLTFVDYISRDNRDARRFDQLDKKAIYFIEELERVAQAPVSLINTRFPRTGDERKDLRTVIDRRNWTALWNPLDKFNPYLST
ncbi:MAG: adenylosuccinate synthetase, partial [gamma proteobacterium symbiont of Ctena orbiculata]